VGKKQEEFDPLSYAAGLLESQISPMDPVQWCEKKVGVKLWSKQREIAQSLVDNKLTAVKSGHGVGKSFSVAQLIAWWVDTHPPDDTMVVSTAPSSRQVSVIMWEEIRKIHRKAKLPGEVQRSDRWLINDVEVAFGRKPQDYDKHAFQGIHRKYVLVIIDEACGIDEWLWVAALALATGKYCRIIAIGNPDDPSSYFAKVCKPDSGWNVIQISVLDSPNFTDEEVDEETSSKLTDQSYLDAMEKEVGRDSPTWTSKVLGEFPEIDEFSTIPLAWVYQANERWLEWQESGGPIPPGTRHIVGADIARFGGDRTAFCHRYGDIVTEVGSQPKVDTEKTSDLLMEEMSHGRNDVAVIDTNGVGAGIYDKLKRRGKQAIGVNPGTKTTMKDSSGRIEFYNLRAALTWRLREALDPNRGATLMLPPNEKLAGDLSAPRWKTMAGGKIVIESKDEIRKRIGRSTDLGDAVTLAFWIGSGEAIPSDEAAFHWVNPKKDDDLDDDEVEWDMAEDEWRQVAEQGTVPVM
jgi:hypothetical protein